jgi:hypothetical protein
MYGDNELSLPPAFMNVIGDGRRHGSTALNGNVEFQDLMQGRVISIAGGKRISQQ